MITKTLKVRVKDRHAGFLRQGAREVNLVWNFCNDLSFRCLQRDNRFLSGYDLQKYTKGATKLLSIDSTAIQQACEEYATRRKKFKKAKRGGVKVMVCVVRWDGFHLKQVPLNG